MAQIVLSRVGAALGGRVAPIFRSFGRTLGAYVGGRIDAALFGGTRRIEGPRLTEAHLLTSQEGASLPLVYGRVRLAGEVIWAARYRERVSTSSSGGGKSGRPRTSTTTYSYSLSFAVGLCAGEIARVERAWANGRPLDLSRVTHRVHAGRADQAVDPLIEAIEGAEAAPAYRDLAYIVFEDMPLEAYGDAMPQLSFEVVRAAPGGEDRLEALAQSVCLIPGCGEFVYAHDIVRRVIADGAESGENAHLAAERSNLACALDQLQQDLPNVSAVTLVVAWFGDDLRAGACTIHPGVEIASKVTRPLTWSSGGLERASARLLSQVEGAPAYGGTPDDASVLQAIAALKARGLAVTLNPFLLMDIPPGNGLPDIHGGAEQAAFPWRGRIGVAATDDKTAAAASATAAFFGSVNAGDFALGDHIVCTAPDWKYRQFILHYAHLAARSGGVDAFIIGSEMRALTTARADATTFSAVAQLIDLAAEVRVILGPGVDILYGADWSEYAGHQPQDGTGDVFFHLDPLWADSNIAAVGIDWYPPLADWREGDAHLDRADSVDGRDRAYLASRIEGGEAYDWYYASPEDRTAQLRTPIADGAYAKPWVYRAKDLRSFWSETHFDRPGGVESAAPTPWVPQSKPIRLLELGAPAIDKGANAPNLFLDPKSAESAPPPFSIRARDDLIQRRTLEAYLDYWRVGGAHNPASALTGAPMVDAISLWAWDARPYPAFPARSDVWADGDAWRRGHWLNGRAGAATLGELVEDLCARAGVSVDARALSGLVAGYVVDAPTTLEAALAPLMGAYRFAAHERDGHIVFRHLEDAPRAAIAAEDLLEGAEFQRIDAAEAVQEVRVRYLDAAQDCRIGTASARQRDFAGEDTILIDAPLVMDEAQARALCESTLADAQASGDRATLVVSPARIDLEPGDVLDLSALGRPDLMRILRIEEGAARKLHLVGDRGGRSAVALPEPAPPPEPATAVRPQLIILDLPPLPGAEDDDRPLAAVRAEPWRGPVEIFAGADSESLTRRGVAEQPATIGELLWALHPGPLGRWDDGAIIRVRLPGAELADAEGARFLAGANAFAIGQPDGDWEIVQARRATLVAPDVWELSGFLRGLQGSETVQVAAVGAPVVLLNAALARLDIAPHERGAALQFAAPPPGLPAAHPDAAMQLRVYADIWARPFAPAHVRGRRLASGDVEITWVRRTRLGGDAWVGEAPLAEEGESYRVEVLDGATVKRLLETAAPQASYTLAAQIADFGTPPGTLAVRVRQMSARAGAGRGRDSILQL